MKKNPPAGTPDIRPFFVFQWHITDECDQRCRHCYIYGENADRRPETMAWPEMQRITEQCMAFCDRMGWRLHFTLTGGDPLLHPRFDDLTALLREKGIPFSILGNPFHLTDRICRKLKKRGCVRYQMSIDGLEESHDRLRKPGSYRATMEKIPMLNRAGIESVIMTTVSSVNIDEVPGIIDAVTEAKAGHYAFARYCPTGAEHSNGITPERYRQLLADSAVKIRGLLDSGCETRFGKKDHLWTLYDYERGRFTPPEDAKEGVIYGGCRCGRTHLTILPNGDVYACRRVPESKVGRLPEDSLAEIWVNRMDAYRQLDRFEKCAGCELLRFCRGCPAVAASAGGGFYAADPQCWKEKKA